MYFFKSIYSIIYTILIVKQKRNDSYYNYCCSFVSVDIFHLMKFKKNKNGFYELHINIFIRVNDNILKKIFTNGAFISLF